MSARGDETAYASNWKTVLAADAAVGLLPIVIGAILLTQGSIFWGPLLVTAGAVYLVLIARRALRWKRLRRELDGITRPPRRG